jgi:uncharacterized protein (TIRG00374 family)
MTQPDSGEGGAANPKPPQGARRGLWPGLVAVAISGLLLWWALKDVEFHLLVENIRHAKLLPLFGAVAIATAMFPLRVFRWRLLLRGPGVTPMVMWHAVAMGFMANNILPFRLGEFIRPFAASRLGKVSFGAALSSIAVERIFDALALIFWLTVALFAAGISEDVTVGGASLTQSATMFGAVFASALVVAILVVAFPRPAERVIEKLVPSQKWSTRLVAVLEDVRHGMEALKSPARVAGVVAWSLVLWFLNGFSFYVAFLAFDIPVNVAGALLMQGVLAVGISVPSAPGYVGVFEAAILLVLSSLYGVPASLAVAYALTYHFTTFLPITLLGLLSVVRTGLGLKSLRREAVSDHG